MSKEAAIQIAYEYDQRFAVWEKPWSPEDLKKKSSRITVELYPTRNINGEKFGRVAENGPMWVITIRGNVHWNGFKADDKIHDGMVYQVAQKTGHILGFSIGITK